MPTSLPLRANHTLVSRLWRGAFVAYVVSIAVLCGFFAINGPQIRAAAEAQEAQIIEAENKAFCSKLGIGVGTERYAECAGGLTEIRARLLERKGSESIL